MSETELENFKKELSELAKGLKANHLKAAKALAEGKTQEEAYRISGGKAKDGYAAASEMIKLNPKISQYRDLVNKIDSIISLPKLIATKEQKRLMLWEIAQRASILKVGLKGSEDAETGECQEEIFDATSAKTAVAAIAELNKMDGDLAAIKTENRNFTVESLIDELTSGKSTEQ